MFYIIVLGESVITDSGYIHLVNACRALCGTAGAVLNDVNASVFSWTWITMQWNLISRSISVEDIHLEHLDWHGDALKVHFAKSKIIYVLVILLNSKIV